MDPGRLRRWLTSKLMSYVSSPAILEFDLSSLLAARSDLDELVDSVSLSHDYDLAGTSSSPAPFVVVSFSGATRRRRPSQPS